MSSTRGGSGARSRDTHYSAMVGRLYSTCHVSIHRSRMKQQFHVSFQNIQYAGQQGRKSKIRVVTNLMALFFGFVVAAASAGPRAEQALPPTVGSPSSSRQ